jgi:hypothetical protein
MGGQQVAGGRVIEHGEPSFTSGRKRVWAERS